MFADDPLLFGKANVQQITCIIEVLTRFFDSSEQNISVAKYNIMFYMNTSMHIRRQIVQV